MLVAIQPFCSQQCKRTGRFLLRADVTVQISLFMAEKLSDAGHRVRLLLPPSKECDWFPPYEVARIPVPRDNRDRRLEFRPDVMRAALEGCDLVVTHNELMPLGIKQVSGARVVLFNHLQPLGPWAWMGPVQRASWEAADLVAFMTEGIRAASPAPRSTAWPMVYDARCIRSGLSRDIDVLFVQRCSVNNYTHHLEFLEAGVPGRVVFTDPTGYLEMLRPDLEYARCERREDYYELLARSRIAVALMTDDMHGGVAVREAVASGCWPVLLDAHCYRAMLPGWPGCSLEPGSIAAAVEAAGVPPAWLAGRVVEESYQAVWPKVEEELWRLS